jgi:hypothetical protein
MTSEWESKNSFIFYNRILFFRITNSMSLKDFNIIAKLGISWLISGEGAYSSVYKVKRLADNEIYALKKVKMNNLSDKEQ